MKNNDEFSGYINQNLEKMKLHESQSFQFNLSSTNSYLAWNYYFYPFKLLPSTPFDTFLPIDLKYNLIEDLDQDKNYLYGGTVGGKYFHEKLRGNNDDDEQFTIIISLCEREKLLINILNEYFKLPYLNQIIIIWNSKTKTLSTSFYNYFRNTLINKRLRIVLSSNYRFMPYNFIRTDAILRIDDNSKLVNDEIIFAFRVWRANRERLVGFLPVYHTWDPQENIFRYYEETSCEYSIINTNSAFYHRYYHYYYHHILDKRIRNKVDDIANCEDIAFNYMISDLTRKPPIKVTEKNIFNCSDCNNIKDSMVSIMKNVHKTRSDCMNYFNIIYGYNPLLYSQSRSDSVLYMSSLGRKIEPCFKNL